MLVEKLSNRYDYFLRRSGFPDLFGKVFLIFFKFSLLTFQLLLCKWNDTLSQYAGWIHSGKFPGENEAYKINPWWNRFGFSTSPVCIGNLSLPERNFELLMFPIEFLKIWYFPGDIAQTVTCPWLTCVSFKIYTGYK